jgi:hypothetical protein
MLKFIQTAKRTDYTMKVFSLPLRRPIDSLKIDNVPVKHMAGCPVELFNYYC